MNFTFVTFNGEFWTGLLVVVIQGFTFDLNLAASTRNDNFGTLFLVGFTSISHVNLCTKWAFNQSFFTNIQMRILWRIFQFHFAAIWTWDFFRKALVWVVFDKGFVIGHLLLRFLAIFLATADLELVEDAHGPAVEVWETLALFAGGALLVVLGQGSGDAWRAECCDLATVALHWPEQGLQANLALEMLRCLTTEIESPIHDFLHLLFSWLEFTLQLLIVKFLLVYNHFRFNFHNIIYLWIYLKSKFWNYK